MGLRLVAINPRACRAFWRSATPDRFTRRLQFNEIHPLLALTPNLGDHLWRTVSQHAQRVLGRPHPGGLGVEDAAIRDNETTSTGNTWSGKYPGPDRLAQPHINEPAAPGDSNTGDAAVEHLLGIARRL